MYDVVVVGGGGAALLAAIAAREAGSEVLVVSKTPPGLGCCTAYAVGGFTLGIEGLQTGDHFAKTIDTGRGLAMPELVRVMTAEAPAAVFGLSRYGVELRTSRGWILVRAPKPTLAAGSILTKALVQAARDMGVQFAEKMLVHRLLIGDTGCEGLEAIDTVTGSNRSIGARAVVVATGGAGNIYLRTDNPVRITGDGYRLLFNAGATLIDMEFVQFYPLGFAEPGFPCWMIEMSVMDHVPLTNSKGEEFLKEWFGEQGISSAAEANLYARDRTAVRIATEVAARGPVTLHLDRMPPARWEKGYCSALKRLFGGRRGDVRPVKVAPLTHYFSGGAMVDPDGRTAIPGVFACGEVSGGLDGASRVGGNALTALAVFGPRAGRAASEHARSQAGTPVPTVSETGFPAVAGGWLKEKGLKPRTVSGKIRQVCESYLGPVRSGEGLQRAVAELEALREELDNMNASAPRELIHAFEAESLWVTARLVAEAALARRESRGAHYRLDYPTEGDQLHHLAFSHAQLTPTPLSC